MNILLLGSGGREHALAWKLRQSKLCSSLYIAPGNAGTAEFGENRDVDINDFEELRKLCVLEFIEMVVVGPEEPLVNGIYDFFASHEDLKKTFVIGPSKAAAQLEGSKAFSKLFMKRHNIPTATYAEFDASTYEKGKNYIAQHSLPVVLKADGLAAGKGVIICETHEEALDAFEHMILHKQFGEASTRVVIEEYLQGIELSVFVLTNGEEYKIIGHAKDYKRIGEGDTGLNTGGMGCVSPVPFADEAFLQKVEDRIIRPTIIGINQEKLEYKGFLFVGIMNVDGEPKVIEYNCRLGDPETEVILPRLKNDIIELFVALRIGQLNDLEIEFDERQLATVMAVSGGYPGEYKKGFKISGVGDTAVGDDTLLFHAGTKKVGDDIVTNGGRVLAVTSFGETIEDAVNKSKAILNEIEFDGKYYRKDIGFEFK